MSATRGVILAGGKSLRFGEDKAFAKVGGLKLIEKVMRAVREIGLEAVVLTRPGRDYSFLTCRVEFDRIPDQGPLGGLYTAFDLFPDEALLVLTCDMPNLTGEALKKLLRCRTDNAPITLFRSQTDRLQPFPGIYSSSLLKEAAALLKSGEVSMQTFLKQSAVVQFIDPPLQEDFLFLNINSKRDLKEDSSQSRQ